MRRARGRHLAADVATRRWAHRGIGARRRAITAPPLAGARAPLAVYADCVVDAHVDSSSGRAKLIEVNACGWWGPSGSALFHYERDRELLRDPDRLPVRVVVETADEHTVPLPTGTDVGGIGLLFGCARTALDA